MSEEMTQTAHSENPAWFDGKKINEALFCEEFLREYPMVTVNGAFFTVNGRVHDENRLKKVIYDRIKYYVTSGIAKKVANLLDVMRMECCTEKLPLYQDRIHVANGTYYLNGTFSPEKNFCRNRLPVSYNPEAPQPVTWLHFLSQLLEPEDILTLQEFILCQLLCRKFLKGCGQHVRVPPLEENKVTGRGFRCVLFQRKVDTVLFRRTLKGFDIALGNLNVGNTRVLLHELL